MKVVIIGAKGMLGQRLMEVLSDMQPVGLDREEIDITDKTVTQTVLKNHAPEVVINAAAYTDVDGAEGDKETAFLVNAEGVRNVAEVVHGLGATMVHYSTDYVFPGDRQEGYTEESVPGPAVNVYGESKLAGEEALHKSGVRSYLVRTAWLYGEGGKNFVETMLQLAQEKKELTVVNDQVGSPTYAKDVALATRALIEEQFSPGIYHLVNEGQTTWYGFAEEIFRLVDAEVKLVPVSSSEFPRPAKRPAYSMLRNVRGPQMRSWQAALADYLRKE